MGASAPDRATSVWDLADWVKPYAGALLDYTMSALFPGSIGLNRYRQGNGEEYFWTSGPLPDNFYQLHPDLQGKVRVGGPVPRDQFVSHNFFRGPIASGPPEQPHEAFNPVERFGQDAALRMVGAGNRLQGYTNDLASQLLAGGGGDLAQSYLAYLMGGPLAGATRVGLLDQITGPGARWAEQAILDSMYGRTANAADQAAYTLLTSDRDLTRRGLHRTIAGPEAQQARGVVSSAMRGDFLDPSANPWLDATYKRAARALTDQYREGVAPSLTAQFARAGSFGGSAHQQTEAASRYNFGRNLEELAAQIYGDNYQQERDRQLQIAASERNYTEDAMRNRLAQETAVAQALLGGRASVAEAERAGLRDILSGERALGTQTSSGMLDRLVNVMGMVPQIRAGDFQDIDIIRTIGREMTELDRVNREIAHANALSRFQWPFDIISLLSGGIGGALGNSGTSSTTQSINSGSNIARGIGGGVALASLLAGLAEGVR